MDDAKSGRVNDDAGVGGGGGYARPSRESFGFGDMFFFLGGGFKKSKILYLGVGLPRIWIWEWFTPNVLTQGAY